MKTALTREINLFDYADYNWRRLKRKKNINKKNLNFELILEKENC